MTRRVRRRAGRVLQAALMTGGWVMLAAVPAAAALFTWWDGLG